MAQKARPFPPDLGLDPKFWACYNQFVYTNRRVKGRIMQPTEEEKTKYGANVRILQRSGDRVVFGYEETGDKLIMTAYAVFPGIELIYDDVHTESVYPQYGPGSGLIEIHHCREGRIEFRCGDDSFFLAPGDLALLRRDADWGTTSFPTGHYHGITVTIDPTLAPESLTAILPDADLQVEELAEKFCGDAAWFSARSSARIEHVFSELYQVPAELRRAYFKVKVLELLLFLTTLPPAQRQLGYSRTQVRLAKEVSEYLLDNTEGKLTVPELARRFGVSPSLLNASFRGVYGMSPAAYLRSQKMHAAADLLRSTDRTVLDIAGQFGYENGSKFAKAFRDVIGVSPNSYRSGIDQDSCAPEADNAL